MSVLAKFRCTKKEGTELRLEAVTTGSEENKQFWKYTPYGLINMNIDNENAFNQFEVGKEYYVTLSSAEE